jgi:hypothetical protein
VPGDYSAAQANINSTLANGQGNGLVNTNAERGQVWAHLAASRMISGDYSGANLGGANYACPGTICPLNGFGRGISISFGNEGTNVGNSNEIISGAGIPVAILAELDRKTDDGLANTGTMRIGNGGGGWGGAAATACGNGSPNYNLATPSDDCAVIVRNF